jgi:hypothetical protein
MFRFSTSRLFFKRSYHDARMIEKISYGQPKEPRENPFAKITLAKMKERLAAKGRPQKSKPPIFRLAGVLIPPED